MRSVMQTVLCILASQTAGQRGATGLSFPALPRYFRCPSVRYNQDDLGAIDLHCLLLLSASRSHGLALSTLLLLLEPHSYLSKLAVVPISLVVAHLPVFCLRRKLACGQEHRSRLVCLSAKFSHKEHSCILFQVLELCRDEFCGQRKGRRGGGSGACEAG